MNIKLCKLVTGEYVVSDVTDKEEFWEFESPVTANIVPSGQGQISVILSSFDSFDHTSNSVLIQKKHVLYWVQNPDEALIKKYIESTSGITPASTMPSPASVAKRPGMKMVK